ncbi:uncharacterized protein LOC129758417 [Uranotaenia lowii]|uniref:uncharacterized protein LOC129758417 n=1 Tax=Uranotaenia lowii TaxID=190385 RepID=UPI0024791FAD|nr:uncharacterized protein LOC129758417 [Uranotaenia lowii]
MNDNRLSFTTHVDYACKRAAIVTAALSRAMSNNSAILCSVTSSILWYGAAALSRRCYLLKLCSISSATSTGICSMCGNMPEKPRCPASSTSGKARNAAGGPIA